MAHTRYQASSAEVALRELPAAARRAVLREGYRAEHFRADLLAGVVVGLVALPLAVALAIAVGVPPSARLVYRRGRRHHRRGARLIAVLQVKDLFGLTLPHTPEAFVERVQAMVAFESALDELRRRQCSALLCGVRKQPLAILTQAGVHRRKGVELHPDAASALEAPRSLEADPARASGAHAQPSPEQRL